MFPSRITAPTPPVPESEDIFSAALSTLFTDDVQNSHGTPGSSVTYHSPRLGNIELRIPQHPDVEEGRKLFAHYLWNAGVICADALEEASLDEAAEDWDGEGGGESERREESWDRRYWDVRGKRVLELGAGTALPSIICALSSAASTTITDHPSSPALTTSAVEQNVQVNVLERHKRKDPDDTTKTPARPDPNPMRDAPSIPTDPLAAQVPIVNIFGYTWGTTVFYDPSSYGRPAASQPTSFDRIIIADCLWMPSQHFNLVKTVLHFLDASAPDSCALVAAGFHTGREIVRHFFEVATGEYLNPAPEEESLDTKGVTEEDPTKGKGDTDSNGVRGLLRVAEIFEIDVNGLRRPWEPVREGESKYAAKRWCVVAVLVRR